MEARKIPLWQKEIEGILREQFQGEELAKQITTAQALANLVQEFEVPSKDTEMVVALILKRASEELFPLAATYAGFQLGVAWERYQNANRA